MSRSACERQFAAVRNEGLFTPTSVQGALEFPFTGSGVNWGSAAFDPVNQILYVKTSCAAHFLQADPARGGGHA